MVIQKIIKPLEYGAIIRSHKGTTYEAIFKSKVMKLPKEADEVEVEFINNTPIITRYYLPHKEEKTSIKDQKREFKELGGDY